MRRNPHPAAEARGHWRGHLRTKTGLLLIVAFRRRPEGWRVVRIDSAHPLTPRVVRLMRLTPQPTLTAAQARVKAA